MASGGIRTGVGSTFTSGTLRSLGLRENMRLNLLCPAFTELRCQLEVAGSVRMQSFALSAFQQP